MFHVVFNTFIFHNYDKVLKYFDNIDELMQTRNFY